jgi:XrtN system VIT domain protein
MKQTIENLKNDKPLLLGLFFYVLSSVIFIATLKQTSDDPFSPAFFTQYGITVAYLIFLFFYLKKKFFIPFGGYSRPYHIILLLLFNLSAYSLNRSISVFNESADWLVIFLIIENMALLFFAVVPNKNSLSKTVLIFIFSISLIFNFYQALIITPVYGIGVLASLFLGISLHVFVPICYFICLLVLIIKLSESKNSWISIAAGVTTAVIACSLFLYQWGQIDKTVSQNHHQFYKPIGNTSSPLPQWIEIAKQLNFNSTTEKYLKSGLVYQEFYDGNSFFWDGGSLQFEGQHLHDPLVTVATFFFGKPKLPNEDRLKVLDYAYDVRHESADRFWSGLNLKTSDIITNIQLYPSYRIAYTELILRIRNEQFKKRSRWFSQEEAIYTFQLPEEAVVSSLSLWINGQEAKARLTTKSKAENAYNTIVGREMRDPSAVYWMEGSKIRVRVFPCTPDEDRQFKIGITSPLTYKNDELIYNAITFKGPDFSNTEASINIVSNTALPKISASTLDFDIEQKQLSWHGDYESNWSITLKVAPLSNKAFTFRGNSYNIEPLTTQSNEFSPGTVYIDLNSGWTDGELSEIFNLYHKRQLYVYNASGVIISVKSLTDLIELHRPNFSLFPFYRIKKEENSLVITKGNILSPNLSDLENTTFKQQLFDYFTSHEVKIKVYDISEKPSDYMRSLIEFDILEYRKGSLTQLIELERTREFPVIESKDDIIPIISSQVQIVRSKSTSDSGSAPDHLLRLFAYNQVMNEIGRKYFNNDYLNENLINTAATANIVTPISSLIVLETLKDYERFDIDENKDSLGNATIQSSGAVPEPHEWAIIITAALFFLFIGFRKTVKTSV